MKNGTATGNGHFYYYYYKHIISKKLAKLHIKCLSERRIQIAWENTKMVIIIKKGNMKDIKNYRPICLLSNIYKVLTKVLMNRLEKTLDENQQRG